MTPAPARWPVKVENRKRIAKIPVAPDRQICSGAVWRASAGTGKQAAHSPLR